MHSRKTLTLGLLGLAGLALLLKPSGPRGSTSDAPGRSAAEHSCENCDSGHRTPSTTVVYSTDSSTIDAASVGDRVEFGFELGAMDHGTVTMRQVHPDGRLKLSVMLPSGEDLFIAKLGDEWEGRVVPKTAGFGWRILGHGNQVTVEKLDRSLLICGTAVDEPLDVAGLPPFDGPAEARSASLEVAEAQPIHNSRLGAKGVIYLDFDGETVSGTPWNSSYTGGSTINASSPNFSTAQIQQVWQTVSEDYLPFDVNVTTDRAVFDSYPTNRRTMVVFTPDNEWYGTSGGVAYVDVFGSSTYDPPAWVFTDQLGNSASNAAEAASHEAGHTLGLHHDGTSTQGYYGNPALGSGLTTWAPIMGVGYYANITQWSIGEYPDANNSAEDDLAIISSTRNGLGYIADDHSNTTAGASLFTETGTDGLQAGGIIERNTDIDVFTFQTSGGSVSFNVTNAPVDPNLDIKLQLLDSAGSLVAEANPSGNPDALLGAVVSSGTYYLTVTGTGNGTLSNGYSDYGSLGAFSISGTVPRDLVLAAEILSPPAPEVSLPFGTGLILNGQASGGSPLWQVVSSPAGGSVTFSSPSNATTEAVFSQTGTYQLQFSSTNGGDVESDLLTVAVDAGAPTYAARVPGIDLGGDRDVYGNHETLTPVVTDDSPAGSLSYSWTVLSGPAQLSSTSAPTPDLDFISADTPVRLRLVVSDGQNSSFSEVELVARFFQTAFIGPSANAKVWVATGTPPGNWGVPTFNDSSWQAGQLGTGYDTTPGGGPKSPPKQIFNPEIGANLNIESTMSSSTTTCYVRIPFEIEDPDGVISMLLRMKYDDGFVAYINGVEVARDNVGTAVGVAPAWNATAPVDRFDEDALSSTNFNLTIAPGTLVAGTNILAIHGLNYSSGSSDRRFLLSAELDGVAAPLPPPPPALSPFEASVSAIADVNKRGPEDDADGDGWSNLFEHALGTSLTSAEPHFPAISAPAAAIATITIPGNPPEDVIYIVEHTLDLSGMWSSLSQNVGNGSWTGMAPVASAPDSNGRVSYTFECPPGECEFFRLRTELVAP